VVDDGSTDQTALVAEQSFPSWPGFTVLRNPENRGKGFSVKRGVLQARGRYILFSDADLSTPIQELEKLLAAIEDGYDIAIASRAHRESNVCVHQPWYRKMMGRIFNKLVRLFAVSGISDTQCGFKCFKRQAARVIFQQQRLNGFSFDVELLYLAQKAGYSIKELPVVWINSPLSRVRPLHDSFHMLVDLWRIRWNQATGQYTQKVIVPN
jgi:dolichyl-phosphate beta-glucosyltransferase